VRCTVREAARRTLILSLLGPNMLPTVHSYRPVEVNIVGGDCVVGTRWTVQGSNPTGGAGYSAPVHTGPGAHPDSCTIRTGSHPGDKAAGAWC